MKERNNGMEKMRNALNGERRFPPKLLSSPSSFSCRHFVASLFIVAAPDVEDVVASNQHFAQVARQRAVDVLFGVGQLGRERKVEM